MSPMHSAFREQGLLLQTEKTSATKDKRKVTVKQQQGQGQKAAPVMQNAQESINESWLNLQIQFQGLFSNEKSKSEYTQIKDGISKQSRPRLRHYDRIKLPNPYQQNDSIFFTQTSNLHKESETLALPTPSARFHINAIKERVKKEGEEPLLTPHTQRSDEQPGENLSKTSSSHANGDFFPTVSPIPTKKTSTFLQVDMNKQPKDADINQEQPGENPSKTSSPHANGDLFPRVSPMPTKKKSTFLQVDTNKQPEDADINKKDQPGESPQNDSNHDASQGRLKRSPRMYPDSSQQENNNPFKILLDSQERSDSLVLSTHSQHSHGTKINESLKPEHKRLRLTPVDPNSEQSGENSKKKSNLDTRRKRQQVMKIEWY